MFKVVACVRKAEVEEKEKVEEEGEESEGVRLHGHSQSNLIYGYLDCVHWIVVVIYLQQRSVLRPSIVLATFLASFLTMIHRICNRQNCD